MLHSLLKKTSGAHKKLAQKRGAALITVLLAVAVIVMSLVIIIPSLGGTRQSEMERLDDNHEQTAYDSAMLRYFSDGAFTAIYDAEQKVFIETGDVPSVRAMTPYGRSKKYKDKVIKVTVDDSGNVSLAWIDPIMYRRPSASEEDK